MTERSYPAEPAVNLRAVRKTAPMPEPAEDNDLDQTPVSGGSAARIPLSGDADIFAATRREIDAPRPSVDELAGMTPVASADDHPARWGFRGWANATTGGLLGLKPRLPELEARAALAAVKQQWVGHQTIMVANPKGGEGNTVTALMLGAIFGEARSHTGGGVVVWDATDADGTLGARAASDLPEEASARLVLEDADQLLDPSTPTSALTGYLRMQPTRNEILPSGAAQAGVQLTADECRTVHQILARWRDLIILDTDNNRTRSSWLWAAYTAHLMIVPMTLREDSAIVVCRTLAALHDLGLHTLVTNAIVVLTTPPGGVTEERREAILGALRSRGVRNAVEVPWDPDLAAGGRINHSKLSENTVTAWTRVAAMAATSLAVSSPLRTPTYRPFARGNGANLESLVGLQRTDINDPRPDRPLIPAPDRVRRFGA
ncbi:MinD/ParA family ATP-binding protein [Nocardia neocaledoniensis]|uniref:MinD/ParA family ATP-binding protein n=1 Tax=Nocardia neocaledoniensis TaxID=236511 RepID=UPI0024576FC1|nr:hypothetical protein [Nocardia neocaledoniensis]